jgi:hypothetical protein
LAKVNEGLRRVTIALVVLILVSSIAPFARDAGINVLRKLPADAVSAAPLLLTGLVFLIVQLVILPQPKELLKNLLIAAAFLLWGTVQLMPQGILATRLGYLVVALYVLDLGLAILDRVKAT